jgi:hypothetical protein
MGTQRKGRMGSVWFRRAPGDLHISWHKASAARAFSVGAIALRWREWHVGEEEGL